MRYLHACGEIALRTDLENINKRYKIEFMFLINYDRNEKTAFTHYIVLIVRIEIAYM